MNYEKIEFIKDYNFRYAAARIAAYEIREGDFTIVTQVKDEDPYLLEWIAYNLVVGFNKFVVFDNGSSDRTTEILSALDRAGVCVHIPWQTLDSNTSAQYLGFEVVSRLAGNEQIGGWLCFIDCDEFLVFHRHGFVYSFLDNYKDEAAVLVNWLIFGSSGLTEIESGLVIERFQSRAKNEFPANRHVKSFVRAERLLGHLKNSHYFKLDDNDRCVFPDGRKFPGKFSFSDDSLPAGNSEECYSIVQLNHYVVKSKREWEKKRLRGRAGTDKNQIIDESHFLVHDRNEVLDKSILSRVPATKAMIVRLQNMIK